MARSFRPPQGTRFPKWSDASVAFEAAGPLREKLMLAAVLGYHAPRQGRFTLLRNVEGEIAGAACFNLREADVFIDYLTRNDRFAKRGVSVGVVLLDAVEEFARLHRREAIRLDSMQDSLLLDWYSNYGFAREGPPHDEVGWGTLFPMVMLLGVRPPP